MDPKYVNPILTCGNRMKKILDWLDGRESSRSIHPSLSMTSQLCFYNDLFEKVGGYCYIIFSIIGGGVFFAGFHTFVELW